MADQDRALAFYTDVLGFRRLTDQPINEKQRWLELGIPRYGAEADALRLDLSFKDVGGNCLVLSSK